MVDVVERYAATTVGGDIEEAAADRKRWRNMIALLMSSVFYFEARCNEIKGVSRGKILPLWHDLGPVTPLPSALYLLNNADFRLVFAGIMYREALQRNTMS
jgi:hypothetical protein